MWIMDPRIARGLASINDFKMLAQYEINITRQNAMTDEVAAAVHHR